MKQDNQLILQRQQGQVVLRFSNHGYMQAR